MNLQIELWKIEPTQQASGEWDDEQQPTARYKVFAGLVTPESGFRSYDAQTQLGQTQGFKIRWRSDLSITGDWKIRFREQTWSIQKIALEREAQFYWIITASHK